MARVVGLDVVVVEFTGVMQPVTASAHEDTGGPPQAVQNGSSAYSPLSAGQESMAVRVSSGKIVRPVSEVDGFRHRPGSPPGVNAGRDGVGVAVVRVLCRQAD